MTAVTYTSTEGVDLKGTEVGAWLFDTTAESVTASELVTNGTFTTDTSGWTPANGATLASVAGELRITADGTIYPVAYRDIACVIGKRYVISCTARRGTCVPSARLYIAGIDDSIVTTTSTTNVTIYADFIATLTTHQIHVLIDGTTTLGETAFFDNISCIIADEDLSATDQALRYHGTITKAAVNTGAGLMGYSNFSTLNFLSRAYGADLDITTQLTIMAWVKYTSGVSQSIAGNYSNSGDVGGYILYISTAGALQFSVISNASVQVDAVDTVALTAGEWTLVTGTMTTAGLLSLYKNSTLVDTTAGGVIGATTSTFKVGFITSNAFNGSIAGVRVINAVLTAAQIKNIYDNEKTLFKKYAPYRAVSTEYSLDIILESAMQQREIDATVVRSLGGNQETIERNRDKYHSISIGSIARVPTAGETIARQAVETFLESVQNGETFTLDIYGSVAVPDDPVDVIADQGYSFNMVSNNLFTTSIRVREV